MVLNTIFKNRSFMSNFNSYIDLQKPSTPILLAATKARLWPKDVYGKKIILRAKSMVP